MGSGNPPQICGTNTGYHMYVEFGSSPTDTVVLNFNLLAAGLETAKNWNILTKQIPCNVPWKAPADCVQYFTGASNTIQSYGFAGGKLPNGMMYTNCIRTEIGYCGIKF